MGAMERILILGVGNPILSDDRAGLLVAEKLASASLECPNYSVALETATEGGLEFLEKLEYFDKAIIIDAMVSGALEVGEIRELHLEDLQQTSNLLSSHGISLKTAVDFGRNLGLKMPSAIRIFGIEVSDNLTVSEEIDPRIEAATENVANLIRKLLREGQEW
jgi:hydrogenase maturation protease